MNLSFTDVTDGGLRKLSGLSSLKSLNLDARQITDIGLAALTSKHLSDGYYHDVSVSVYVSFRSSIQLIIEQKGVEYINIIIILYSVIQRSNHML